MIIRGFFNMKKSLALSLIFIMGCSANVNTTDIDKKVLTKVNNEVVTKNTTNIRETIKTLIQGEFKDLSLDDLTYEVGNPLLAKIDNQGNLTPLGTGIVEIKVFKQDEYWAKKLLKTINVRVEAGAKPFMLPPTLLLKPEEKVGITSERMKELQSTDNKVINVENRTINAKSNGNSYVNSYDQFTNKLYSLPVLVGNDVRADFPNTNLNTKVTWINIDDPYSSVYINSINGNSIPIKLSDFSNTIGSYDVSKNGNKVVWEKWDTSSTNQIGNVIVSGDASVITRKIEFIDLDSKQSPIILPTPLVENEIPKLSSDGSKVVWVSDDNKGSSQIYSSNTNGTIIPIKISTTTNRNSSPRISSDGSKVIWSGVEGLNRDIYDPLKIDIYVSNTDGTGTPIKISTTTTANESPQISPDGSKVVWSGLENEERHIYVSNTDGTGTPIKISMGISTINNQYPKISGNGKKVIWEDSTKETFKIFVSDTDGKTKPVLISNNFLGRYNGLTEISDDASKVVWMSIDKNGNTNADIDKDSHIFTAKSDGTGIPIKISTTTIANSFPQISSDGSKVIWSGYNLEELGRDIYIRNSDGTGITMNISKTKSARFPRFGGK
jgi:Tol biopolymer transport system component